jgi:hypothetical protein
LKDDIQDLLKKPKNMKNNLIDFRKNVESDINYLMKDEFEWDIYKKTMK